MTTEEFRTSGIAANSHDGLENACSTAATAVAGEALQPAGGANTRRMHGGESLLGSASGELVLRITAGPHAGRIVRLSAAKCTVGSAPYCTLRLHGTDVEPVQCVILHGRGKSIVRRWSGSTLLNDRTFEDMPLNAGDRLSIGPVELQVLSLPWQLREAVGAARRFGNELQTDRRRLDSLTARLELSNRQGRRRLRAAVAKLRKYQLRMAEMEGRRRLHAEERTQLELERSRLEAQARDVQARLAECESRRLALNAEEKTLQEQAQRLRELAKQSNQDRQAAQEEINRRREELAAAELRVREAETKLNEQLTHVASEQARIQRDSAEMLKRENQLKEQSNTLAQRTAQDAARARELETRERTVAQSLEELARRQAELERQASERAKREAAEGSALTERERALAALEKSLPERETALAQREKKLVAQETLLTERRDALAHRDTAVGTQPSPEIQRQAADLERQARELETRKAELDRRAEELNKQSLATNAQVAELERQSAALLQQAAEVAERAEAAEQRGQEASARLQDAQRRSEEVAGRCEALKRHWNELIERERLLDRRAAQPTVSATTTVAAAVPETAPSLETAAMLEQLRDRLAEREAAWEVSQAQLAAARREAAELSAQLETLHASSVCDDDNARVQVENQYADHVVGEEADDAAVEEAESSEEASLDEETSQEAAAAVASKTGESAADVLRRLGLAAALDEADDHEAGQESSNTPPPASVAPVRIAPAPSPKTAPTPDGEHAEDDSLNDYMAQLFQRLGVRNDEREAAARQQETPSQTASREASREASRQASVDAGPKPEPAEQAPVVPLEAKDFIARSVAAERGTDLTALRELANVNARAAVANHQIKTSVKASRWKGRIAAASAIVSLAAVGATAMGHMEALPFAVGGLAMAALFGFKSIGLRLKARKTTRSLDDVLQKSAARLRGDAPAEGEEARD